jgi:hypothetical protein
MKVIDGLFLAPIGVAVVVFILVLASAWMTSEDVLVTSRVVHVDYDPCYMTIYFLNGDVYRVEYPIDDVIDFDESMNVTVKLQYMNVLWCTNNDDVWSIKNIIKY